MADASANATAGPKEKAAGNKILADAGKVAWELKWSRRIRLSNPQQRQTVVTSSDHCFCASLFQAACRNEFFPLADRLCRFGKFVTFLFYVHRTVGITVCDGAVSVVAKRIVCM